MNTPHSGSSFPCTVVVLNEHERTSVWQRVCRYFATDGEDDDPMDSAGRGADERDEPAPGDASPKESKNRHGKAEPDPVERDAPAKFSTRDLRDRVVLMLLFDQVVREEQVETAWRYWRADDVDTPDTLWRVVSLLPDVDADAVYAQAARAYAFEPVDFNMYGARAILRKRRNAFSSDVWQRLVDLNLAPVQTAYDPEKDVTRWTFATHDPARTAVQHLLSALDVPAYELRYASRKPLEEVFDAGLPRLAHRRAAPASLPAAIEREGRSPGEQTQRNEGAFAAEVPPGHATGDDRGESEGPPTLSALFDAVLIGMTQTGTRMAYLFGDEQDGLVIYHRRRRKVQCWHREPRISAEEMIDYVSGRIHSLRPSKVEKAVERWMDDRRVTFRLSVASGQALPEGVPATTEAEVAVVEVVH